MITHELTDKQHYADGRRATDGPTATALGRLAFVACNKPAAAITGNGRRRAPAWCAD